MGQTTDVSDGVKQLQHKLSTLCKVLKQLDTSVSEDVPVNRESSTAEETGECGNEQI